MKKQIKNAVRLAHNELQQLATNCKFKMRDSEGAALISRNAEYKNKYSGERCFILGNGPSIKKLDFSILENEYTFTVNKLPQNDDFPLLKTNFHMWADEAFFCIDRNRPEDLELIDVMKAVNSDGSKPTVFYKYEAKAMVQEFNLDDVLNICYFACGSNFPLISSINFANVIPGFPTVVQYAICLAVYMGFRNIYLLGCDSSGFITTAQSHLGELSNIQYGYHVSDNEKKWIKKRNTMYRIRDELSWYVNLFDNYELLDKYCQRHSARLINCTYPSLIDNLEFQDINEVLNNNRR